MTPDRPPFVTPAVRGLRRAAARALSSYNRWELHGETSIPDQPCLIVSNHGFGTLTDLNVLALFATLERLSVERAHITLVHQLAWTVGLGPALEQLGGRKASRAAALEALAAGQHVLLFPGGDVEAAKSHRDRDRVIFDGRSGFVRLAREAGVPIVPIVTRGAGNSLYVFSDGRRLASALRIDKVLRLKALPISVSAPWGLSIGLVGLLPYLPLPVKLDTVVLPPVVPSPEETDADLALRIEHAMQAAAQGTRRTQPD